MADNYVHWAWLVRDCRESAKAMWRDEYAPHVAVDDLFANHLRRVRIVCDELPGGVWTIAVHIRPRRAQEQEWYWFKVRKLVGVYYLL